MVRMRYWLMLLGLAKIAVYMLLLLLGRVHPFVGDNAAHLFVPIGHRIATEGSFNDVNTRDDNSVPPAYPFVIAAMEWIGFGKTLWAMVYLQFLADTVVALMMLRMGNSIGGLTAGFAAGIVWLLYPPAWVIATWISPETLFTSFLIIGMTCLCSHSKQRAVWGGLFLGIATLFRANCLFLPLLFVPYWLWRRSFRLAVVFSVVFGVTVGLWTLRNILVVDDLIVVSSSFGSAFLQGSDERFYHGKATEYPTLFSEAALAGLPKPALEKSSAINSWLLRVGLWHYANQMHSKGWPAVAGMIGRKFVKMWYLTESGSSRAQGILLLCALLAAPLGLIELATWFKPADPARFLCSLTVLYWILIHSLIVPLARYMLPVFPMIALAGCFRLERTLHGQPTRDRSFSFKRISTAEAKRAPEDH